MGKDLQAGLSLAYAREQQEGHCSTPCLAYKEGREGYGEWSQRVTIPSAHLFIICPLLQEWNLLKNKGLVCCVSHCIHSAWFMLDAQ